MGLFAILALFILFNFWRQWMTFRGRAGGDLFRELHAAGRVLDYRASRGFISAEVVCL